MTRRTHGASAITGLLDGARRSAYRVTAPFGQLSGRTAGIALAIVGLLLASALSSFIPSFHGFLSPGLRASAFAEDISTFAPDCSTPKTTFFLGDTVCAVATGAIGGRRIVWIAPDGTIPQVGGSFSGTGSDQYTLMTGSHPLAQTGRWKVQSMDNGGAGFAIVSFLVLDPSEASNADLAILKFGPLQAFAGGNTTYTIEIINRGPDTAEDVVLSEAVPNDSTFVSESQDSGPTAACSNPSPGGVGASTCTIPSLAPNERASFTFVYNVNADTPLGHLISNTATVSSSTNELFSGNNTASHQTDVGPPPATPQCSIACPGDITANNTPNECSAIVSYATPGASGNCADPETGQTPAVQCNPPSGSVFPIGTTVVTCSTGGTLCSFTVIVEDTRPPVQPTISCPANVTADEEFVGSGSAPVSYPSPTTTGNCVIVTCNPPSGSQFPLGPTPVDCSATDSADNTVTCSFTVTVTEGGSDCTLTCPADITQTAGAGECSAIVNYTAPTTSGDCATVTCTPASASSFPVGTTAVTCTSTVGPNCDFTVTVVPASAPTITTCATNKTISANEICEAAIPNLIGEVVATGCSVTLSQSPTAGSIVGPGTVTVTITAENSAGETTCTATVTVLNTILPTIACPADLARSNDPDACGVLVSYVNPPSNNACSEITVSCSPPSGAFFPIGLTNVLCTATDVSGNTATCTFKVTVTDTQVPLITCPANITRANDHDRCAAVVTYTSPTATDNCPGVVTSCSPASGTEFPLGTTTVTCNATDAPNNQSTCSFSVTINDSQPPTITCSSNIAVGTAPNSVVATVTYQSTVSDNCPGTTTSCSPASGSQFPIGTTTVNCNATDSAGNQSTCTFTVTVSDQQPPTINCPASIARPNDLNLCGAVVTYPAPQVTDNQPGATFSCTPASGFTFPVGVTQVTCTATDAGGNQSSCSFAVTVTDTQLPVLTCPANITAPNTAGQCSAVVNPGVPAAADNCPGVTVAGVRSDGLALNAAYPVGTTTITWTARDAAGNQRSCAQTIVVNDTQAPSITGAAANPSTLWPPNHKMVDVTISYGVTDNCTPTSAVSCDLTVSSNEPPDGGGDGHTSSDWTVIDAHHLKLRSERSGGGNGRIYTITITCRDVKGNTSTKTVTVTVPHNR